MSNDRNPCALHVMYRLHRIVTTKLLEDPSFDVLQHRQLFEISNETSPETDFKIDQHEIESTLEKFEIKEIESDGLDMIASDIIKSKGHLSPALCQNPSGLYNQSFALNFIKKITF